jgi:iron complex transport system substrate-binding protein
VAQTPAGEHRRIVDMADTQVLSFGPTSAQTLDALARALYAPDAS